MRRPYVADAEEVAAARADADRARRVRADARLAAAPARRAAIATGPALRDIAAAVDCHCACHPHPADLDLHDGGSTCGCQLTPQERRAQWDTVMGSWPKPTNEELRERAVAEAAFAEAAAELDVTAHVELSMCPFVIVGNCDGRGFYLRERHGEWRVTIAGEGEPAVDPWGSTPDRLTIDVAAGDEGELVDADGRFSDVAALRIAVGCVREAVLRDACAHDGDSGTYCCACGVPMAEAMAWRFATS
ncbi:hypothetical protein BH18ACT2_BH18ACT2_09220 [soil metagenome]